MVHTYLDMVLIFLSTNHWWQYIVVSKKLGYPKLDALWWKNLLKWMIWIDLGGTPIYGTPHRRLFCATLVLKPMVIWESALLGTLETLYLYESSISVLGHRLQRRTLHHMSSLPTALYRKTAGCLLPCLSAAETPGVNRPRRCGKPWENPWENPEMIHKCWVDSTSKCSFTRQVMLM